MDTYVTPGMFEATKLIVGAAMTAGKLAMTDKYDIAITFGGFHHAGVANGEGFCVFNDVAITAKMLIEEYKIKRILIIDTDAHQGNGTMDIFYNEPRVLFISIHQDPRTLYPGRGFVYEIGSGAGKGYTVNIPMPMFAGNEQYEYALKEIFVPLAGEFQPEMIIRNGGSDPHYTDQLTQLGLDLDGLNMVGKIVRKTVDETSKKLIDMTVSGYGDLTSYGWLAIIAGVSGLSIDFEDLLSKEGQIEPQAKVYDEDSLQLKTQEMIETLNKDLKTYWGCFR
jgi:acetoin utilization protein AcuC